MSWILSSTPINFLSHDNLENEVLQKKGENGPQKLDSQ